MPCSLVVASFTSSFHHHVFPQSLLPFVFSHNSLQAFTTPFFKKSHKSGAPKFTSSQPNPFFKSFSHVTVLQLPNSSFMTDSFFITFSCFLLSTSTTSNRCCNSHGITFTSRKYFLFSLLTNAKSISVSFAPALNVSYLAFFRCQVFAKHTSFSSQYSSNILPSKFLSPIPFPSCTPSKPSQHAR